jgi:tetratricopeptide (TPR) repeat protein
MTCEAVERDNIIERYIAGRLDSSMKEQWEQHYFGCERCASQLETMMAIQQPLRSMAEEIRQEMPRRGKNVRWIWAGAAIAATLLAAVAVSYSRRPAPPVAGIVPSQHPQLAELARLDPPAYPAPVLRGAQSPAESQFREAMQAYSDHDYRQAITGLQAALRLDPGAESARFFLGACYLMSGDPRAGTRELQTVSAGHSPFAEEAAFDQAKGYLLQGDQTTAIHILHRIADNKGEFSTRARELITRIEGVR